MIVLTGIGGPGDKGRKERDGQAKSLEAVPAHSHNVADCSALACGGSIGQSGMEFARRIDHRRGDSLLLAGMIF